MAAQPTGGQWPKGIVSRVEGTGNRIALTFDDGPNAPSTARIGELLSSHGVKATFFSVGRAIEREPDVSLTLLKEGHVLADHSYSHSLAGWLAPDGGELAQSRECFERALGIRPAYFRPPFGLVTRPTLRQLAELGMTCVTWDVVVEDWKLDDAETIANGVLDALRPGSIVLLHDGHNGDPAVDREVIVTALPLILDGLRERSLEPVGLDELLGTAPYFE